MIMYETMKYFTPPQILVQKTQFILILGQDFHYPIK
jgi:hypothetical protein